MTSKLVPLLSSSEHTFLNFAPTELTIPDAIIVIFFLILKSIWSSITGLIPGIGKSSRLHKSLSIPTSSVSMPFHLTKLDIKLFCTAVNTTPRQITWNNLLKSLFLSALTEGAMLLLLAKRGCPVKPLGSVNVRNRIELLRSDLCDFDISYINMKEVDYKPDGFDLSRKLEGAVIFASMGGKARRVRRGIEIDLIVELRLTDGTAVFRQIFTMLEFVKGSNDKTSKDEEMKAKTEEKTYDDTMATIWMHSPSPSQWAVICKDYNPIHMSGIAARMYGFPGKIAHGNHVFARAINAVLENGADDHLRTGKDASWAEVAFKRPVVVPAELEIMLEDPETSYDDDNHSRSGGLAVMQKGKICVEASYGVL